MIYTDVFKEINYDLNVEASTVLCLLEYLTIGALLPNIGIPLSEPFKNL